ncbi:hypothetical protein I552_9389 [Mycobacterium xenopi 3993]|nr:hypothetical protein I552_9389 [Mycobacterium xenopi 3993]
MPAMETAYDAAQERKLIATAVKEINAMTQRALDVYSSGTTVSTSSWPATTSAPGSALLSATYRSPQD